MFSPIFWLFKASVRSLPPGPPLVHGVFYHINTYLYGRKIWEALESGTELCAKAFFLILNVYIGHEEIVIKNQFNFGDFFKGYG